MFNLISPDWSQGEHEFYTLLLVFWVFAFLIASGIFALERFIPDDDLRKIWQFPLTVMAVVSCMFVGLDGIVTVAHVLFRLIYRFI